MANARVKDSDDPTDGKKPSFRLKHIMLPVCVLLLSVAFTLYFFRLMPDEIAYRFTVDGEPDSYAGRTLVVSILLGIQFLIVLIFRSR